MSYFGVAGDEAERGGEGRVELDALDGPVELDRLIMGRVAYAEQRHLAVVAARAHVLFFGVDRYIDYCCVVLNQENMQIYKSKRFCEKEA